MPAPERYIGLMSGTSLDGIDAVLVDLSQAGPQLLARNYHPFDVALKQVLLELHQPGNNELHQAQLTGNQLARMYAAAVAPLLEQSGSPQSEIQAIGCHGQTIRHRPELGYSLQIGNAALLAELTGITVVSDFRSRDIAAGGQGAPLVPAFHDRVLRHPDFHRVIVNIGGISNLTDLAPGKPATGFDCGPGNLLMDAWCSRRQGRPYDENGAWASSGNLVPDLLERLLAEPYFALPPPKSSGRDLFNIAWLERQLQGGENAANVQATLLELTCRSIVLAIVEHCPGATEIYLCGGGAHNHALHNRLAALLPASSVKTTDTLGVDGDFLEATAFAWLAQQAVQGKPANLPQVTGANHPCILGAIYRNLQV
ncbi:MAG: anhydro-N-acetylmuramic acid kinase [Gallionella sp.]